MSTKTKIILESEAAEKVREAMRAEIKRQFGGVLPQRVSQMFENSLSLFPDIELTKAQSGAFIDLETVTLSNSGQKRMYNGNALQLIQSYKAQDSTGALAQHTTSLERRVWGLSEADYLTLASNSDLPLDQRTQIVDTWKRKPKNEAEQLNDTLLNEDLTVNDRIEAAYKFRGEQSPQAAKEAENGRKTKVADENTTVLDKIDIILSK